MQRTVLSHSPEDTEALARELALWIRPGWVVRLDGDLGSGKSVLARALIRAVSGDDQLEVPSPSFSLMQSYDDLRVPIVHADLYRLSSAEDVRELGLASVLETHALVIEWPGLAEELNGIANRLDVAISGSGERRDIVLTAHGAWRKALLRNAVIDGFLKSHADENPGRSFMLGDASSRRYEYIHSATGDVLLMDMAQQPDGPPVKDGKPYSAIAHLAENIIPVVAINRHLVALGYSAPVVHQVDQSQGLALIEILNGDVHGAMMLRGDAMDEPMQAATELLADMARQHWPRSVPADDGASHVLHDYDESAQLIETDLLMSWHWRFSKKADASPELHQSFETVWRGLLPLAKPPKPYWVLRDFHSPNLIWMPGRNGVRRTGLIDTQDAVMGHPAYDLMSLLQDARCDVPVAMHDRLFEHYVTLRQSEPDFDAAQFATAYAVLGAQRACKLLGIFVRLCLRDGKPQYLQHLPRQKIYLQRNLAHPALAPLKQWFETNLPEVLT
jgi:tRNA threonylcarbamoyl adenosine modification protein YjeE